MSRRKLYKELNLLDIKNDIVRRDLFWYAICERFNIDLGEFVWYDLRVRNLILGSLTSDKMKKYFTKDVRIQVDRLYGERKQSRIYKKPTPARIIDSTKPTFSWARALFERARA